MMEEDRERKWGRTDGRGNNDQRGQNYDQSQTKKDSTIKTTLPGKFERFLFQQNKGGRKNIGQTIII